MSISVRIRTLLDAVQVLQAPEFGGAKTDVAGTIVQMLEVAESDFTRLPRLVDLEHRRGVEDGRMRELKIVQYSIVAEGTL